MGVLQPIAFQLLLGGSVDDLFGSGQTADILQQGKNRIIIDLIALFAVHIVGTDGFTAEGIGIEGIFDLNRLCFAEIRLHQNNRVALLLACLILGQHERDQNPENDTQHYR